MAEALKHMYNQAFFNQVCPVMESAIPAFDSKAFLSKVFDRSWPTLELKQRVRHIAQALHYFMPDDFREASPILVRLSENLRSNGLKEQGFACIFIPDYIEVYGIGHPEAALEAIEKVTQLVSAEFAIRPFIIRYREKTMRKMLRWSKHREASVRRLSSEGCRPRLPWAMALPDFKNDPFSILPILENLKEDKSEYVRRSVANNLNDISKDHPDLVLKIAKEWKGKHEFTDWILRHGCRSLLKKGDEKALVLHGFSKNSKAKITNFTVKKSTIKIGDYLYFNFDFISLEKKPCDFRLEYAIDYLTSSGKTSRKIFRITERNFSPLKPASFYRKQSFKDLTTRKHYKGKHLLTLIVNGKGIASTDFLVA